MTFLTNHHFSKLTFILQLAVDSQCYLAQAQMTHWANYSLASNILTNIPEALSHHLNRILFTAQWHIVSIQQPVSPDTSDLIDGSWQWMIINVSVGRPAYLQNCDIPSENKYINNSFHKKQERHCSVLQCVSFKINIMFPFPCTLFRIYKCQQMQDMQLPEHS